MALGDLLVSVRASADEWAADLKKIQRDAKALENGLKPLAEPLKEAGTAGKEAGEKITHSIGDAHAAAKGLEQMIGIHLPKAASRLIAESSVLGPILAGAFSGVAVLGLIQVLGQLPAMFEKISGAITGWNEASKKAYADFLSDNAKAVRAADDLWVAQNRLANRDNGVRSIAEELEHFEKKLHDTNTAATTLAHEIDGLKARKSDWLTRFVVGDRGLSESLKDLPAMEESLAGLNKQAKEYLDTVSKLRGIEMPKAAAAASDKALEGLKQEETALKKIAADHIAFWNASLAEFKNRTFAGGEEALAGLNAAKKIAADIIALDKERMRLEEEAGDALIKQMQFWESELRRIRNESATGGAGADLVKQGEDAGKAAGKAIIDNFKKLKQSGQDFIDHFTDDMSQMFIGMIANGQSFWQAFRNFGRTIIASIADTFLSKMMHNFLDPFAAELGKALNEAFSSAAKGAKKASEGGEDGEKQFSLGALVKGGLIAAATTLAIAGLQKVGSAIVGMFGKLRKLANEFVNKTQDTLTTSVTSLIDNLTDAQAMGTLTADQVKQAKFEFEKMWAAFQKSAAAAGIVGQQGLATMTPFIASWREWLDALEETGAELEHIARVEAFRNQVLDSTKGATDLEEAIISLQNQGVTTSQIISFLGDDIRRFADNLRIMGLDIPPAIQAMVDALDALEGRGTKLRHAINAWMLPETGLVNEALRREGGGTRTTTTAIRVPATASDLPMRSSAVSMPVAPPFAPTLNFAFNGVELSRQVVMDTIVPVIDDVIETGQRSYLARWALAFRNVQNGLTSTVVPAT